MESGLSANGYHREGPFFPVVHPLSHDLAESVNPTRHQLSPARVRREQAVKLLHLTVLPEDRATDGLARMGNETDHLSSGAHRDGARCHGRRWR